MNPWKLLDTAQTPGDGAELTLFQRDSEFSIKADSDELMNSRVYGSEQALATLGTRVLPLPAPANTSTWPSSTLTALRCAVFRSLSR